MQKIITRQRLDKITAVVKQRQFSLRVVLENIHDPHNVGAIFRSCDAAGVPKISLVYNNEVFPKINKISSASALKWVEREKFVTIDECYASLRKEGFKIIASILDESAKNIYDYDLTKKTAIVLGNENRGVSEEAAKKADGTYFIPMYGMIQSLNVSVAAAVTLFEAVRQRRAHGMYEESELQTEQLNELISNWANR